MKIMTHNEREIMKRTAHAAGDEGSEVRGRWHRFLSQCHGDGADVSEAHLAVPFETYQEWLRNFPGWSYGIMHAGHSAWRPEYARSDLPMNRVLEKFSLGDPL